MKKVHAIITGVVVGAMASGSASGQTGAAGGDSASTQTQAASATPEASPDDPPAEDIIVTGLRSALEGSLNAKRSANQVIDAISAVDIGKLPDVTVADALQRVTGVQIQRNFGEGSRVSIRGLQSVRVEIDGRAIYSIAVESSPGNGSGRNAGLEQLSSSLFSRIEVIKTPIASQIEGGLGGVINAVSYKPFDFRKSTTLVLTAEGSHENIRSLEGFSASGLISHKFADGKLGFVLQGSYQNTPLGFDSLARMNWNEGPTGVDLNADGKRDIRPNAIRGEFFRVDRKRIGLSGNVTFRPVDELGLYVDGIYTHLDTDRYQRSIQVNIGNTAITNPLFNQNYIVAGTVNNPYLAGSSNRSEPTSYRSIATGGRLDTKLVDIWLEGSVANNTYRIQQQAYELRTATNQTINFDFRTRPTASFQPTGSTDLGNVANYVLNNTIRNRADTSIEERAVRLDTDWHTGIDFLTAFKLGGRYSRITRSNSSSQTNLADPGEPPAPAIASYANLFSVQSWPLFGGTGSGFPQIGPVLAFDDLANFNPAIFGNSPLRFEPSNASELKEETLAGYVQADFESSLFDLPMRGNIGVRVIKTNASVVSNVVARGANNTVTVTPSTDNSDYVDVLPSGNIAFNLTDELLFRLSAAKVLARQGFGSLSPAYTANVAVAPVTVSGGNVDLQPTRVKQADISLEYYFGKASYASITGFYKDASGFPVSVSTLRVVPGFEQFGTVLFSQPVNQAQSTIKGFEVTYQQTFDFLPGILSGLGGLASFTYADGKDRAGQPVVDLSKESYNLTGFYERGGFNTRLSYVWRSERLYNLTVGATDATGSGIRPNYVEPVGTLDASVSYDVSPSLNIYMSGSNLLFDKGAVRYFNVIPDAAIRYDLNERRVSIGARLKI